LIKRLGNESGYSLAEVMVAIMLLTIAIIPMVGMFDTGLKSATQGSDYDKARALANKQMETAKNLTYVTVRDDFPAGTGAPETGSSAGVIEASGRTDADYPGFEYRVRKAYARPETTGITEDASARTMMTVTVTVDWGSGKSYSTTGLVSK
jgi:hypothetical protein